MLSKWEFEPIFECYILAEPRPKGRPRFTRKGHAFTDKLTRAYENYLKSELSKKWSGGLVPKDEPLGIECIFHIKKPNSSRRDYPTVRSDLDNYLKALLDALNGVVIEDDSSIVDIRTKKIYSTEGFIELRLYSLNALRKKL